MAEAALFAVARILPLEVLPTLAVALPVAGMLALVLLAARARPSLGETALAVDAEGHLGDRIASALSLATAFPALAGPADESIEAADDPLDESQQTERFVRRQRADAAGAIRLVRSDLFRPRISRNPAAIALAATLLLVPLIVLPNPQDARSPRHRQIQEEAQQQAERIDQIARDLESKGANPDDPRTQLAPSSGTSPRSCAPSPMTSR